MGREIRKVTPNYEHPRDGYGDYIPVYDDHMLPDAKPEERTWYQFFEDTTEGTPCSPPFETKEELIDYLCTESGEGSFYSDNNRPVFSREVAEKFVNDGYAPTFVIKKGRTLFLPPARWRSGIKKKSF